jgi:hydroxyacylglutathione hydrolase
VIRFANTEPLEDTAQDVLKKARLLAAARRLPDAAALLDVAALQRLQDGCSHPGPLDVPEALRVITTDYLGMRVNCFLLLPPTTDAAILFDTGSDVQFVLNVLNKVNRRLEKILITHGHGDHVAVLEELATATGAEIFSHSLSGKKLSGGEVLTVCGQRIRTHHLPGHAVDALAYFLPEPEPPLLVAGDAVFARSLGGIHHNHDRAVDDVLQLLRSLPPETVILPGHGPLTTTGSELAHNPFLAGR